MNIDLANRLESDIDQALAQGDLEQAETLARRYQDAADADPDAAPGAISTRFRSRWLAAQVALAAGQLEECHRRLTALLPLPADLPAALACRIWLAFAETQARRGLADPAREHLARAQALRTPLLTNPLLKLRELRIRLVLGEVTQMESELASLRQTLENRDDRPNLVLLLAEEGRAWDEAGRLDQASVCWKQAEERARVLGNDPIRADVLIQLGRLAHLRGHLQEALDRYDAALAATPVLVQGIESRLRRLLVLLDLNQWGQGRTELDRLEPSLRRQPLPEELRGLEAMAQALVRGAASAAAGREIEAFEAAFRGDLAQARTLYEKALEEASAPARRARLALSVGLLALAARDPREARRWLAQAEALAREQDLPEVLWRALQGRGQIAAEVDGDDLRARELLEEAVLVSEAQTRQLRHRVDAMTHGLRRGEVLRRLVLAACRRGDAPSVFRYQELERGRLLLELWRAAPPGEQHRRLADDPRLAGVEQHLASLESEIADLRDAEREKALARREQMLLLRDRLLDEYLRDRSRVAGVIPTLPELTDLEQALEPGVLYVAPVIVDDDLHLLVSRRGGPSQVVRAPGSARELARRVEYFRRCLEGQLARYDLGYPLGPPERRDVDARLEDLGTSCLGDALWQVLDTLGTGMSRIAWVPDDFLHGIPLHALRRSGRYLVQTHEVIYSFGGALVVQQARTRARRPWLTRALVISEVPKVLRAAQREGEGVAGAFWSSQILHGEKGSAAALRQHLGSASVVHFACHAYFDPRHPLSACIGLPSGQPWRALEWLDEPLEGLPLVTLSACRSAEVGPLAGKEVFGLVTGLLAAGTRAVVAGLWPVGDREALPFMWRFYRQRMTTALPEALARTQRQTLVERDASPVFWAAFAFFGDGDALPPPGRWWTWLARWRQRRHERRFSNANVSSSPGV